MHSEKPQRNRRSPRRRGAPSEKPKSSKGNNADVITYSLPVSGRLRRGRLGCLASQLFVVVFYVCLWLSVAGFHVCLSPVVVIVVDDMGYNDLGIYGSPTIATPNLDR